MGNLRNGLTILSVLAILPLQALAGGASVVEAYADIRAAGFVSDLSYDLRQTDSGWVTTSPDWGNDMPVTVDASNGYIEIWDEGTGGGSFQVQVVLWRQADGQPLVGIAQTGYEPPYAEMTDLSLFGFDGTAWDNWTSYAWPEISLADFMPDDMSIGDLRALKATGASVHITLPQHGLNPVAYLTTRDEEIKAVCGGAEWFVIEDPTPYYLYCELLEARLYRQMEIIWDKDAVQFSKGDPQR